MRLRQLDLIRYGKFTDHAIDFGEKPDRGPDLHIVYGLNEAGKSTALSAYLDLLFGIEERSGYGFLHQYGAMEVGAILEIAGARHTFRRVKQRTGSLRDASGRPAGEAVLGGALSGLTREAYRMMFSLDDQTLEDGGNAILESKGDLGELLFSASAGLVDLSNALAIVATEADRIFRKRAPSTEIASLKRRLTDLKTERDRIDVQASVHSRLVAELRRAEEAYDEAVRERGTLKARRDEIGILMRLAPFAADHARLSEELAGLADVPRPPDHWAAELPSLMVSDATLATALRGKDERIERLRVEVDGIEIDRNVLSLGERIDALMLASSRFQTAEADLPRRRAALAEVQGRLAGAARSVAGEVGASDPDILVVDVATLGVLRGLIEEWSGIETRLAVADDEASAADFALAEAAAERAALDEAAPLGATRKAALQASVSRLREGDLLASRRVAGKALAAKAQGLDDAVRNLGSWLGQAEGLEELAIPAQRQVKVWREALAEQDLRRVRHRERRRELIGRRAEVEAEIGAAEAAAGAIGDEEAEALRQARERAWAAHRERSDAGSAEAFERAMRAVDAIAEARLANADLLAELRRLRRELAVTRVRIAGETELLAEVDRETADLADRVAGDWPPEVGIAFPAPVGDRLEEAERWITGRDHALAALAELRSARAEAYGVEAEIRDEGGRLAEAMGHGDIDTARIDVAVLLQEAESLLAVDAVRTQARAAADKLVRDRTRTLEGRRRAADSAAAARALWAGRWERALSSTWLSTHAADREAVRAVVDVLTGLPSQLAERDGIQHRITAMETDCATFLAELDALYRDLGEAPGVGGPAAAAALRDRHEASARATTRRRDKERELADLATERQDLLDQVAIHDARKSEILGFFRSLDLADVGVCLARCAHRDRAEGELGLLAARIMGETGATSMDDALKRLEDTSPTERAAANDEHSKRIDDLDVRLQGLFAAKSTAADRLAAVGGDDAVARIEAERRTVTLQIEDKALRFLHLRAGALLADRALQAYREKYRGSMMRRASDAFRAITRDAYTGLTARPDKGREVLFGLTRSGGSKPAIGMSKGTRFQLYLALRLAGYEEFALSRGAIPFIADDIMETFDEPRSEQVIAMFGNMSAIGQVIYLTHHRHVCDLARKVVPHVRIHELSS